MKRWLEEKRARGVKQVRVESVLEQLDSEPDPVPAPPAAPKRPRLDKRLDGLLYAPLDDDQREILSTGTLGLMGTWEVARYLGVEKSRVARWLLEIQEGKTPIAPPVARLKSGSFWLAADVEAKLEAMYAEAHRPYGRSAAGRARWATERRDRREQAQSAAA